MKMLGVLLFAVLALCSIYCQRDLGSEPRERALHHLFIHIGKAIDTGDRSQFLEIYRSFDPNDGQRVAYDRNLVFAASSAHDTFFIDFIIASGIDINCRNDAGQSCIHSVVEKFDGIEAVERLRHLVEIGLNITQPDNNGETMCHYAARGNRGALLILLPFEFQGLLDAKNKLGQTPLMICAQLGHVEAGTALLERGAVTNTLDSEGRTALDYASTPPASNSIWDWGISDESKKKLRELLSKDTPSDGGGKDTSTGSQSDAVPEPPTTPAPGKKESG
jgi:Ankyrin repeats (many copies)